MEDWLEAQVAGAPADLVARTLEFARAEGPVTPASLARAGRSALEAAVRASPDRGAALDLLAADALVTLALAAQTETDPAGLEAFAARLRTGEDPAA